MKTKLHSIVLSVLAVILIGFSLNTKAQTSLLAWQFSNPAFVGNEATATSTSTNSNVETSTLSRGSGLSTTGVTLARGFSTTFTSWTTGNTTKADALTNNEYFEFNFKPKANCNASLGSIEARVRRSANGPTSYRWMYSLNDAAFVEIGTTDITGFSDTNTNGVIQSPIDLSGITALQNLTQTSNVKFRIYMWGVNSGSGTFAFARYAATDLTPVLELKGTATLPISLISFTGKNESNGVKLAWQTASERNNSHFEVLRSGDDQKEESIATVNGKGNNSSVSAYFLTDYNPLNGNNYYTLKQFDFDGTATSVAVCAVNNVINKSVFQVLGGNDLNSITCTINSNFSGVSTIKIIDLGGQIKATSTINLLKGNHQIVVPVTLDKGIYFASFSNAKEQMTFKFSK